MIVGLRSATPTARTAVVAATATALIAGLVALPGSQPASAATKSVTLRITGGHATDPRDAGRPVVRVAAALGVPANGHLKALSVAHG